jgi:hypothetical protein
MSSIHWVSVTLAVATAAALAGTGCAVGTEPEAQSDDALGGLSDDALACTAAIAATVIKNTVNHTTASTVCILLGATGPQTTFACGVIVGSMSSKIGPNQFNDAVCGRLKNGACVRFACDPIGSAWQAITANDRLYSKTCAHDRIAEWVNLRHGRVVGSGSEVCANAPNQVDPNPPGSSRGPIRPVP